MFLADDAHDVAAPAADPMAKKQAPKAAPKAPDVVVKSDASIHKCCNCSRPLGDMAKTDRMVVDDGAPDKSRPWCPACFVAHRAPMEPDRWKAVYAVGCQNPVCGWSSVVFGAKLNELVQCPKCGSPRTKMLIAPALIAGILKANGLVVAPG